MNKDLNKKFNNQRPPVVVVLGHVDHGKTTLLDKIRQANIVSKEAGGITQSIGAYEIERDISSKNGVIRTGRRKITFIDTPGHEAFSKMRARGARAADLAVLIVAADDGVQPQTKEAIAIIKTEKIPFIVAINKIDKNNANVEKVKNDLTANDVLLEGYGGNVSFQLISATEGTGVEELLDLILLSSEFEDLPFDVTKAGKGFILEAKMDKRRGIVVSGVIKDGTVSQGDFINSNSAKGKIKQLENFLGEKIKNAMPSSPVLILGFETLPEVGEEFFVGKADTQNIDEVRIEQEELTPLANIELKKDEREIRIFLKADVSGSLEALREIIENISCPEKIRLKILGSSVGDITDGDVKSAISTKALLIGFRVKTNKEAITLAQAQGVRIITSEIIYELVKVLEENFAELDKEIIKGDLEILAIFGKKDGNQVVGGKVVSGSINNNSILEIKRGAKIIGQAKLLNLQQEKKDAVTVDEGDECGTLVDSGVAIKVGDHLLMK